VRCGFLLIYAPTPYNAVFLLHAPAPAPIKIGFGAVQCGSCGCVGEAYTPTPSYFEIGSSFFTMASGSATLRPGGSNEPPES
jgi:hypothetical protein